MCCGSTKFKCVQGAGPCFSYRYEKHVIYWKALEDRSVGIATVLHEGTHQLDRFRDDVGD